MLDIDKVRYCYSTILRREPSRQELNLWTGERQHRPRTYEELVEALVAQATEVRSIARLYLGLLNRLPESLAGVGDELDSLTYWTGILRAFRSEHAGLTYQAALAYIVAEWLREPELSQHFAQPSSDHHVSDLCKALLGRRPEPIETSHWATIAVSPDKGLAKLIVLLSESNDCKNRLNPLINERLHDAAIKLDRLR